MILFHSDSKNNMGRAIVESVWQSCNMPLRLSVGDPVFIKCNDENGKPSDIHFLGVVDRIEKEALQSWPDSYGTVRDPNAVPTIYTRPAKRDDFGKSQGGFNYKKKK